MDSPAGIFPSVLSQDLCLSCALCLGHYFSMAGTSFFPLSQQAAVSPPQRGLPAKNLSFAIVTTVLIFPLTLVIEINLLF